MLVRCLYVQNGELNAPLLEKCQPRVFCSSNRKQTKTVGHTGSPYSGHTPASEFSVLPWTLWTSGLQQSLKKTIASQSDELKQLPFNISLHTHTNL